MNMNDEQFLIPGYDRGSDITIFNTIYYYPRKMEDGKYSKPAIDVIFRDNKTGEKKRHTFEDPMYEFYIAEDSYLQELETESYELSFHGDDETLEKPKYNFFYAEKDRLFPIVVPYSDLDKEIAVILNQENFFWDNLRNGQREKNALLHTDNRIFRSDMQIQDFYRYKFNQLYKNQPYTLKKGYLDIEVDGTYTDNDFPDPGEVPINAVSQCDASANKMHVFILREPKNPLCKEFEDNMIKDPSGFINKIRATIEEYIGIDKLQKYGLDKLQYIFYFYDMEEEVYLIYDLFKTINNSDMDFIGLWNAAFDIPYIIERVKTLGYNPEEVLCDQSFPHKTCKYIIDERNKNDIGERGDQSILSSKTLFIDQMIQLKSRRKSTSYPSLKLNDIAELVAGINKYDYSSITASITRLPYLDFFSFIVYNMIDVICLGAIESKCKDLEYIFTKAIDNNTRYSKIHKNTITAWNDVRQKMENRMGYIMGNNVNRIKRPERQSYPGAYVSDPRLWDGNNIQDNTLDGDFARMYPSEIGNNNMSVNTMIGKIYINHPCRENETYMHDKFNTTQDIQFPYDRGRNYVEDISGQYWVIFGYRWLNLANFKEMIKDIEEFYTKVRYTNKPIYDLYGNLVQKNWNEDYINLPFRVNKCRIDYKYNKGSLPFYVRTVKTTPLDMKERLMNELGIRKIF